MKNPSIAFIFLIALMGCDNHRSVSEPMNMGEIRIADEGQAGNPNTAGLDARQINQIERKFIKNGQIEFETKNLNKTREAIFKAIKKFDAYISSENEYKMVGELSSNLVIRVPADNFDKLIGEITFGVQRFDRKEIYVQDVTEDFLDVETRLRTKKELEDRYLEILKKATTVSDILGVERQIGELRAEIESFEGRLQFLNNQVSFSTLTVRVYEPLSAQTEFGKKFKNGFKNGWDNLILFFVLLVNVWPFILMIFGILILFRIWKKRKRSQK